MVVAEANTAGWAIGYWIALVIVAIVVVVVTDIIATATKIANVAKDATRALALTRDRTEALWQVSTTNSVAADLLAGARTARHALGGTDEPEESSEAKVAQEAELRSLTKGPQMDPGMGG